jgi:hypothetical protein
MVLARSQECRHMIKLTMSATGRSLSRFGPDDCVLIKYVALEADLLVLKAK